MEQETLLSIDAMNVIRRIYEGNPAPDSPEKVQGAMRASLRWLENTRTAYPTTHRTLVMDAPGKNWRHTLYPAYKEKRTPMPEELRGGVNNLLRVLKGRGWHIWEIPGVEADDVLFSLARAASLKGIQSLTLSTDKDVASVGQFEGARVRDHFNQIERDEAWCLAKFGVKPIQLLDLLALTGDSTDGIPGVEKVGPKTAAKWLNTYGTLEDVLAAAPEIKGTVGDNLRAQLGRARLSRQLTEMKQDLVPTDFDWDLLLVDQYLG